MLCTAEPEVLPLDFGLREWADAIMHEVSVSRLRADVEAFPAPRNRLHSPKAMADADDLIVQRFRDVGWKTELHHYHLTEARGCLDYSEGPLFPVARAVTYADLAGTNILGVKEGSASTDAIVVGAHHDTIRDSPGADDNTASVAALLELARLLASYSFKYTLILAAFDMEEINLFGSQAFVAKVSEERRVKGAIIYETMAYTNRLPNSQDIPPGISILYPRQTQKIKCRQCIGDWNLVLYRKSATQLAQCFGEGLAYVAGAESLILMRDPTDLPVAGRILEHLMPAARNFGRSDHRSFWQAGIPAIMISDTANFRNPHYHKPSDTPDTLDYDRLAAIVGATTVALVQIAELNRSFH